MFSFAFNHDMSSDLKDFTKSSLNFELARFSIFMKPTLISLINYDRAGYLLIINFIFLMLGKKSVHQMFIASYKRQLVNPSRK